MRPRELWREMFRWPVLSATLATIVVLLILLAATYAGALAGIAMLPALFWARSRVRRRRIEEMRVELSTEPR
jgi:hypothetical protein